MIPIWQKVSCTWITESAHPISTQTAHRLQDRKICKVLMVQNLELMADAKGHASLFTWVHFELLPFKQFKKKTKNISVELSMFQMVVKAAQVHLV